MQVQDYSPNKADWYHSQRITDDEYLPGVVIIIFIAFRAIRYSYIVR